MPCVPLILTAEAALENMGVRVFFLADDRVFPENYANVTLNNARMGKRVHSDAMPEEGPTLPLRRAALFAPFVLFLAVYLPTAGHGFVRDDYQWVLSSRVHDWRGLMDLFHFDNGFYRPLVSLTFMLDGWMFGADPFGYGMTNIVLALLCCASIAWLARSLGLSRGAAMLAGSLCCSTARDRHGGPVDQRLDVFVVTLMATLGPRIRGCRLLAGGSVIPGAAGRKRQFCFR
jgi:hypothetical protein